MQQVLIGYLFYTQECIYVNPNLHEEFKVHALATVMKQNWNKQYFVNSGTTASTQFLWGAHLLFCLQKVSIKWNLLSIADT